MKPFLNRTKSQSQSAAAFGFREVLHSPSPPTMSTAGLSLPLVPCSAMTAGIRGDLAQRGSKNVRMKRVFDARPMAYCERGQEP